MKFIRPNEFSHYSRNHGIKSFEDTKLNYEIICVRKLCYDFCSVSLHRFVFLAVGIVREKFLDPGQRKISLTRFKKINSIYFSTFTC